jgi:hypothetical protein
MVKKQKKKIVGSKKLSDYKEGCDCTVCECSDKKGNVVKVYFCPKCKSEKVGYVFGLKNIFGVIPKMECKICYFHAPVFPQWVIEQEELTKLNKKTKKKK